MIMKIPDCKAIRKLLKPQKFCEFFAKLLQLLTIGTLKRFFG